MQPPLAASAGAEWCPAAGAKCSPEGAATGGGFAWGQPHARCVPRRHGRRCPKAEPSLALHTAWVRDVLASWYFLSPC